MKGFAKSTLKKMGLLDLANRRVRVAKRHLTGIGLEIGAMHRPLKVPSYCQVKYVDIASREESIRKFPELDPNEIVQVDYLCDGFTLEIVPNHQFDFIIANHVLEHSPNPIGTLLRWSQTLKPSGKIFCTLPLADRCFDQGRTITPTSHMVDDFHIYQSKDALSIKERNREHYLDWLRISEPNILGRPPLKDEELTTRVSEMLQENAEIHFHTFSKKSIQDFFSFLTSDMPSNFKNVLDISSGRNEVIAVIEV